MSQVLVEGAVQELAAVALMELIFNPKIRIGRMNTKLITSFIKKHGHITSPRPYWPYISRFLILTLI